MSLTPQLFGFGVKKLEHITEAWTIRTNITRTSGRIVNDPQTISKVKFYSVHSVEIYNALMEKMRQNAVNSS